MTELRKLQETQRELEIDVLGLQYALDKSVPQLVGALVVHLARKGFIKLEELEAGLRDEINPDLKAEDSTGLLFDKPADLVSYYRRDGAEAA